MFNSTFEPRNKTREIAAVTLPSFYFSMQHLVKMNTRTASPVHDEPLYRLVLVTEGSYYYWLGKKEVRLSRGKIGFIKPRDNYELPEPFEGSGFVISFTQDFLKSAVSPAAQVEALHFGLSTELDHISIPESESKFLIDITQQMFREYCIKGMKDQMVTSLFEIFMMYINRSLANNNSIARGKSYHHTRRFIGLLDKYFIRYKMAGDYADLMAVTPAYLNNVIRETLGNTTSHFINQRILAEAKRLIIYDELNMKEVADQLGFMDPSHFSKFFKRTAGKKFTEFRRSYAD